VPSASIVLALRGGGELDKRQVAGIKHLVAAAVPGLSPERVTLVDDRGTLLAQAEAGDGSAVSAGEADCNLGFAEAVPPRRVHAAGYSLT
jgi:flagellar M-ring protein FliF